MLKNKYYGICSTCESNMICKNSSNSKNPIWYCEEFDIGQVNKNKNINASISDNINVDSKKIKDADIYKGLCINCENRKICKLQIPGTGVWHCEEYL